LFSLMVHVMNALTPWLQDAILRQASEECGFSEAGLEIEDWAGTAGKWPFIKYQALAFYKEFLTGTVVKGGRYENLNLVSLQGKKCELSHFLRPARPLVVVFGSAT
jgi:hypothetical protein